MRSKIGFGVLGITVAFLLATNPVVVNAHGLIGSAQIKNNAVKSKHIKKNAVKSKHIKNNQIKSVDIKNGSIQAEDLAADAVPTQIKAVRRLAFEGATALSNGVKVIAASTTVTVDGNDIVILDASMQVQHFSTASSVDLSTCVRPAGSGSTPTDFDPVDYFDVNSTTNQDEVFAVNGSAVLPAGTYEVGVCISPFSGTNTLADVAGTVLVIDGTDTGPLGKPTKGGNSQRD